MFFGMTNSPATFQHMMDTIFQKMIDKNEIIVYMDDILIFTETTEKLDKRTRKVLDILQENNLYLKPEKCKFKKQ
jgi:type IV secretory pathway VirB4 component